MKPPPRFVHLHCHSEYSLLDSLLTVKDLVDAAARFDMPAVALTDYGNLMGAIEFHDVATRAGVQPILGMEVDVKVDSGTGGARPGGPDLPVVLLACDQAGYHNLVKLASFARVVGPPGRQRIECMIDLDALARHAAGLIATIGAIAPGIARRYASDPMAPLRANAGVIADIFGAENSYLAVLSGGERYIWCSARDTIDLSDKLALPAVLTGDVHYLTPEDASTYYYLVRFRESGVHEFPDRPIGHPCDELWFRSGGEMAHFARDGLWVDRPDILARTLEIAERCRFELPQTGRHMPAIPPPAGESPEASFRELCLRGLAERYGASNEAARERLEYEMATIESLGHVPYFLFFWDVVRFALEQGVAVGPGCGAAPSSIVAYCLGITDFDPLAYGLIFERFMRPDLRGVPGILMDFCAEGRGKIIEYLRRKYGEDHVAPAVAFGRWCHNEDVGDVGRLLDVPGPEVDEVAQRLGWIFNRVEPSASELVIADMPLADLVPMISVGDRVAVQYPGEHSSNDMGFLVVDFRSMDALTVIDKCRALVRERHGKDLDFAGLPLDDDPTWDLLCEGRTEGLFMFDDDRGEDFRRLLMSLAPRRFEDLAAFVGLCRPGPIKSKSADLFVDRCHGRSRRDYDHPVQEEILRDTYGLYVYQEQCMLLVHKLAGFTLAEANTLRKDLGKRKATALAEHRARFIQGAALRGVTEDAAARIWDDMERQAQFGFNKSHAVAYGMILYRMAYLTANYVPLFWNTGGLAAPGSSPVL